MARKRSASVESSSVGGASPLPATPTGQGIPQTFRFTAPEAVSVLLVGDFTHWQRSPIPMRRGAGGVWEVTVALAPGIYHYRFLVDGEWRDDPECTLRVPNPYGSQNNVRFVS
ncbi:MAG: glycogen-binding domain-containing protein [Verrucomicrobiota bacterium]|nr:glycogen-binding domain-containing protein [Limisphaera sp.]MDW8381992.1 glycogen-binding domain-containing protein [Verrucomicrobiota bacterium]